MKYLNVNRARRKALDKKDCVSSAELNKMLKDYIKGGGKVQKLSTLQPHPEDKINSYDAKTRGEYR